MDNQIDELRDLQEYLSKKYQGKDSFLEKIVFPIFGDGCWEDHGDLDVLEEDNDSVDSNNLYQSLAKQTGVKSIINYGCVDVKVKRLRINVYEVIIEDYIQMQRNRVGVQTLIRHLTICYESAFIIFHYSNGDKRWNWRFSFYHKFDKTATESKRFTFVLGPGQSCRTAAVNFKKLMDMKGNVMAKDIIDAFSVEALSDEFFTKYKQHYERFVEFITGKKFVKKGGKWEETVSHEPHAVYYPAFNCDDKLVRDYVKKLLGRIVFLHFLQKKGWLGVPENNSWGDGDQDFMLHLFENASDWQKDDFLDCVLEPLFSEALDTDRGKKSIFDTDVPIMGSTRMRIPYLNGGLFEKDECDKKDIQFPSELFQSLFDFLSQYNFTIDENDPDDAQVGVDPEMLGRIFENLLEDNKDKGAFYTPKEIVRYMCRQSLIAYLNTNITDEAQQKAIETFVKTYDVKVLNDVDAHLAQQVDEQLKNVKICDPAIGSGAFPMGLLKELFLCRGAIENFDNAADIKRHIIQNNIYGVDIERGAVDIARLRFWLSLVVDETEPQTLPNLDFKIMQGNSLLESYKKKDLSKIAATKQEKSEGLQMTIFDNTLDVLRKQLNDKINQYYGEADHQKKADLVAEIQDNIKQQLKDTGCSVDLSNINIQANDQFFLWHTWFSDVFNRPSDCNGGGGFDVVIGNPPYGAKMTQNEKEIYRKQYKEVQFKINTYSLFVLLSIRLLRQNGISYYIIPNTMLDNYFEEKIRISLLNEVLLEINDLSDKVFETAVVHSMIFGFMKSHKDCMYKVKANTSDNLFGEFSYIPSDFFISTPQHSFDIRSFCEDNIQGKIKSECLRLFDVLDIRQAIKTGDDKVYIVSEPKANNYKPILRGKDVKRYQILDPHLYVNYGSHLACPRTPAIFEQPKILIREAGSKITATYDEHGYYIMSSLYNAILKDKRFSLKYLLALINSSLFQYLMNKLTFEKTKGAFTKAKIFHYYDLPVKVVSLVEQETISNVVDKILGAKQGTSEYNTSKFEEELDMMIYKIYGLTNEDIDSIESQL